jgi:glycosyltransferase involved in cell wall biosynthesis
MTSILVVLEKKPFGGAERATCLVLELLAKAGCSVTVLTGFHEVPRIPRVRWIYSESLNVPSKFHLWMNLSKLGFSEFDNLIKKSDVVYIPRLAYPVIFAAKKYGKKVVVHLHDYQPISYCAAVYPALSLRHRITVLQDLKASVKRELLENEPLSKAFSSAAATPSNRLCRHWLAEADEIICVSKKQKDIIASTLPELASKLRVVYNPLPNIPLLEKKLSKQPMMLFLGGDSYLKGFDLFLEGSYRLLSESNNVKFQLTKNIRQPRNRAMIKRFNRQFFGAFSQAGYVDYERILGFQSVSLALLFPSIWEEPLPYAVVESMLFGTVPIASRVGGVPEMVEDTYAENLLFNPGNVEEFTEKMKLLLSLPQTQLSAIMKELRQATLARFNNDRILHELCLAF